MPKACNFIKKETLTQVFYFEFCEISKSTFCYRTPPVAASEDIIFLSVMNFDTAYVLFAGTKYFSLSTSTTVSYLELFKGILNKHCLYRKSADIVK